MKRFRITFPMNHMFKSAFVVFFLCITLPLFILGSIQGFRTHQGKKAEYHARKISQSQQIFSGLDQEFNDMKKTASNIILSRWLSRLNNHIGLYDEEFGVFERQDITQNLASQSAAFHFLSDIIVAVPNNGLIINNMGWFSEETFCEYNHDYSMQDGTLISNNPSLILLPTHSFACSTPNCVVYMVINTDRLVDFTRKLSLGEFSAITIAYNGEPVIEWAASVDLTDSTTLSSDFLQWGYSVDLKYEPAPISLLLNHFFLISYAILSVFVAAIIAFVLSYFATEPLCRLLEKLPIDQEHSKKMSHRQLSENLDQLIQDNVSLRRRLNQQMTQYDNFQRNQALMKTLACHQTEAPNYMFPWIPWHDQPVPYCMILLCQKANKPQILPESILSALSAQTKDVIPFTIPSADCAFWIWFNEGASTDILSMLSTEVESNYFIAISDIYRQFSDVRTCYMQTKKRLDFQLCLNSKGDHFLSPRIEVELFHSIQSNKPEECGKIIDENGLLSSAEGTYMLTQLLLRISAEFDFDTNEFFAQFEHLRVNPRQDELKEFITKFYSELCAHIAKSAQKNSCETAVLMQAFVKENYHDPEMSLKLLAEVFHSNVSVLSKMFKTQLNINFSDYLLNIRIEHAKLLLSETDMAITQISEKVGYQNYISFKRAFIRTEEISPKEYRQNFLQQAI